MQEYRVRYHALSVYCTTGALQFDAARDGGRGGGGDTWDVAVGLLQGVRGARVPRAAGAGAAGTFEFRLLSMISEYERRITTQLTCDQGWLTSAVAAGPSPVSVVIAALVGFLYLLDARASTFLLPVISPFIALFSSGNVSRGLSCSSVADLSVSQWVPNRHSWTCSYTSSPLLFMCSSSSRRSASSISSRARYSPTCSG